MVTFEDIRNNAEIRTYIEKGNENLGVLGFTKHSIGHAMKVSFLERMLMCRRAAEMLGCSFKLKANGSKVL